MTEKWPKNIDHIAKTLLAQNSTQWAFHVSQELYDINFQINTKIVSPMLVFAFPFKCVPKNAGLCSEFLRYVCP